MSFRKEGLNETWPGPVPRTLVEGRHQLERHYAIPV